MRDEIALEAMKIYLKNALDHEVDYDGYESFEEMISDQAYVMADAMRARSIQCAQPTPTTPTGDER